MEGKVVGDDAVLAGDALVLEQVAPLAPIRSGGVLAQQPDPAAGLL